MSYECDNGGGQATNVGSLDDDGGEPTATPSTDTLFSVLAHQYRRYALDCVREQRTKSLADIADAVAVRVFERPVNEIPADAQRRIYLELYHTHIPKLEAARVVKYDQSQDTVTAGDAIERAAPFLTVVDDDAIEAV